MVRISSLLVVFALSARGFAGDWPQFLGPNRDGVSEEKGLIKEWGESGPPKLWQRDVGEGFSGVAVAGERAILFHRLRNDAIIECLNVRDGRTLWKTSYETDYSDGFNKGDGPRATPTIAGNRVVVLGAEGMLVCLDLEKGTKLWQRNLQMDYGAGPGFFGIGTSPVVDQERVLVNVGGKRAGIVAFALEDGKELWKATDDAASYASPVVRTIAGRRLAVFFTRNGVALLDPADGKVNYTKRWRARYEASVNAATPLVIGDLAFFSTTYETGALLLKLGKGEPEEVWSNDESMSNHYNTAIHHDGFLYGFHGRQEATPSFRCIELKTGKVRWEEKKFGCGSLVLADGKLFLLTERGELILALPDPDRYVELARAPVFAARPCRAQIALSNGRLFARDERHLVCFDVKGK